MSETVIIALISSCGGGIIAGVSALVQQQMQRKREKKNEDTMLMKRLDSIDAKLDNHIKDGERAEADRHREKILIFADECSHCESHSFERWQSILEHINLYEAYTESHKDTYPNAKAKSSIAYLKDLYEKRLEKGDFI